MPSWEVHFRIRLDSGDVALNRALARAQARADVLRDIPLPPGVQVRLHRLNALRAAGRTIGSEEIDLSDSELESIAEAPDGNLVLPPSGHDQEREARNSYEVMRFISMTLDADPLRALDEPLIRDLHRRMLDGLDESPGHYRQQPTRVGDYVPPAPNDIARLMGQLVDWLNEPAQTKLDAVTRAVLAHFYIVSIHPFADGNGRTARAVESFLLYRRTPEGGGVNARGFHSLANFYYRRRDEYHRLLDAVRADRDTDVTPLVRFAALGLVEELETLCAAILHQVRIIAFRDYARGHLSRIENLRAGSRSRLLRFVLSLLDLRARSDGGGVPLRQLREGEGLLCTLYAGQSSGTLNRDLRILSDQKLIAIREGIVQANLELMSEFSA